MWNEVVGELTAHQPRDLTYELSMMQWDNMSRELNRRVWGEVGLLIYEELWEGN